MKPADDPLRQGPKSPRRPPRRPRPVARCKHCDLLRKVRCRGLCQACYDRPEIRILHGPISPCGWRGLANGYRSRLREPEPTTHLPGTPEKVEVMRARVERGEHLYSPHDAKHDFD